MKKTNPHGVNVIRPFHGDSLDKARISAEGGSPPGRPAVGPSSGSSWTARLKRRFKSMLAWLARGAEHSCPT